MRRDPCATPPGASREGTRGREPTAIPQAIVGGLYTSDHSEADVRQNVTMPPTTAPVEVTRPDTGEESSTDTPWIVLVWNDPINLMSYVTLVFQKVFGYSLEKATALMLDVHHKGRAVVSSGAREKAEIDVFRLHEHGLWATMQKDE